MRLRFRHICVWLLAAGLLSACGSGGTTTSATLNSGVLCNGAIPKPSAKPDGERAKPVKAEGLFQRGAPVEPADLPIRGLAWTVPSWCSGIAGIGNGNGVPFTFSGVIRYEDLTFGPNGFTGGSVARPVRFADVDIVRCSDGAVLGSGTTSAAGAYSVTGQNPATAAAGVFVRARAHGNLFNGKAEIGVIAPGDTNLTTDAYGVVAIAVDERNGSINNLDIYASDATVLGGAFNIFDVAVSGLEFLQNTLGIAQPLEPLGLVWQDQVASGTVFNPSTNRISLTSSYDSLGRPVDTDEYDDMVIMHEVGHYIVDQISRDDSPGGSHVLSDTTQDARLAWSEGWGNFYAAAGTGRTDYVDTDGGNSWLVSFDLERLTLANTNLPVGGGGAANELGVAATLWDALDSPLADGSEDLSDIGAGPIMSAVADMRATTDLVTFGRFINHLYTHLQPSDIAPLVQVSANHAIAIGPDAGGDDPAGNHLLANAKALATPLPSVPRTATANLAFDSGTTADTDLYTVTLPGGGTYSVCTFNLADGADTVIELLDASATTVLASNDNASGMSYALYGNCGDFNGPACPANTTTALASSIDNISPAVDTDYVIRVRRATQPPPSAGLFGAYSLMVTATN